MWPQLKAVFPGREPIERSSMNSWDDPKFVNAISKTGKKKIILAGLWTRRLHLCLAKMPNRADNMRVALLPVNTFVRHHRVLPASAAALSSLLLHQIGVPQRSSGRQILITMKRAAGPLEVHPRLAPLSRRAPAQPAEFLPSLSPLSCLSFLLVAFPAGSLLSSTIVHSVGNSISCRTTGAPRLAATILPPCYRMRCGLG